MVSTSNAPQARFEASALLPLTLQGLLSQLEICFRTQLSDPSLFVDKAAYIDGRWVSSSDGKTFHVQDPFTGLSLGEVPDMTRDDVASAVTAAKAALPAWSALTAYQRQAHLNSLLSLMRLHARDLALILTAENGKPLKEAHGEIAYGAGFVEWFQAEAVRTYGHNVPSAIPGTRNSVIKQPIGVCALITPWNFPNAMITRKLAPALAAGCTVVIKAPAETPFSALAMCVLCERVGIPRGVVNCVTVDKGERESECGLELCENPDVSKISFTGSTPVGRLLMKQSSSTLKKLSFELGGNAPFIVFDDADIDVALAGLVASKFRASGQTCVCANRIYVQSGIYDEFATSLASKVSSFQTGDPMLPDTQIGPLVNSRGVDKVQRHVEDAVAKGAKVLAGGRRGDGCLFEPTVLSDVPAHAAISTEETFGPLAALFRFDTEDQVIASANDSEVGLAGYVFTRDVARVHRVSERLAVGMVAVNTGIISQPCVPFGGVKGSGFGREGGRGGIDEYMIEKLITIGGI